MRKVIDLQKKLFGKSIFDLALDVNSRDEIPKILLGLQYIYKTKEVRDKIFEILKIIIPETINKNTGRAGMDLWKILVLGTIRLNCNCDYDKLLELANEHRSVRIIMGHDEFDFCNRYALQTIKDNVALLTPEVIDRINKVVIQSGHQLIGKKSETLKGKCDSFVLETNVHFPTDINLLHDAIRIVIVIIARLCTKYGITGWRQYKHNLKKVKKLFNKVRKLKRSTSKNKKKQAQRDSLIIEAYNEYIEIVSYFLINAEFAFDSLKKTKISLNIFDNADLKKLEKNMNYVDLFINQIKSRVIDGKKIPHDEKIFSIFEEHTEWISKGKAGVPQELGIRVCILEDQFGFILNHKVMQNLTDEKITVSIVLETQKNFMGLTSCSFDKGFYNPENKIKLEEILEHSILPKKGRLSAKDKEKEHSQEFIEARKKHSGVESAINALENHGLDRCPDHGIAGFNRYVSLAVLARNIQILGNIIQKKELKRQKRKSKQAIAA